jgi:TetR/AcrR family transcriptional repressor of nem operon
LTDDHSKSDFALGCLIGNLSLELSNASDEARSKLLALLARWQEALAVCLREAQERNELDRKQNADELAAIVIEAYEGAAMRGKIEQSGNAYERFEKVVLPRLLR